MKTDFAKLLTDAALKTKERALQEQTPENAEILEKAHPLPPEQVILPPDKPVNNEHDNKTAMFVMGKSDNLPSNTATISSDASVITKPKFSFAETLKRAKEDEKRKVIGRAGDETYGLGLTKKVIAKHEAKERHEEKELHTKPIKEIIEERQNEIPTIPAGEQLPILAEEEFKEIVYDEDQQAAIRGIMPEQFACLIGAAGTGKTTTEKEIVRRIEHSLSVVDLNQGRKIQGAYLNPKEGLAIAFCAFTGRASQQIKLVLPNKWHSQVSTIHSMLGYAPTMEAYYDAGSKSWKEKKIFRPSFNATNKLPYDIIVMDESGMTPIKLWNEIEDARKPDCRVIAIGDINQLPPVQGRSFFGFAMINWPTFTLTKIHRQAAGNPIIANAHRVLNGEQPIADPKRFVISALPTDSMKACQQILAVTNTLAEKKLFDPLSDALIVPQNKGDIGQLNLNQYFLDMFNKEREENGVVINKRHRILAGKRHHYYAIGDKIMLRENDNPRRLTNGMIGFVTNVQRNPAFMSYKSDLAHHSVHGVDTNDIENANLEMDLTSMMQEMREENAAKVAGKGAAKSDEESAQRPASHIVTVRFIVSKNFWDGSKKHCLEVLEQMNKENVDKLIRVEALDDGMGDKLYTRTAVEQKLAFIEEEQAKTYREIMIATTGQFEKITHAYAFTCHKSQGGEYPTVIIALHMSNMRLLYRELLYTAITRAQEKVVLLCQPKALRQALKVQRIKGNTIDEKARAFNELAGLDGTDVPNLPDARKLEWV